MIKNYFYQGFKKVIGLFLIGIIFFSSISSVYAKILTIDEINNEFKTSFIDEINKLGSNLSSSVDTTNKTLDVYSDSEKMASFKYTDEYIEYDNRSAVVSKETANDDIGTVLYLSGIIQSILNLSGYEDKTISDEDSIDFTTTYDTYGIQMETEHYEYSGEEDGGTWSMSGDYIKYFKMSFDTDKIDALMDKYGVDASTQDPNKEIIANLTPTLKAKEITENSVTLYPHIPYTNTDPDYKVYCYVYRSTSENGTYEKISDMAVNCLDDVGIVDDELQSNTTYYYKAIVMDETKYSDVLEVTTKSASSIAIDTSTNTNKDDTKENPQTGVFFPTMTVLIMMIGSIIPLIYVRKKSVFKKI